METILWTVLVLGVLVFVHELGHFVAAKAAGIQVPRFSIGLGPRLVGFRIGETEYVLSAIPFGGYVKMSGMEGEDATAVLEGDPLLRDAEPSDFAPAEGPAAADAAQREQGGEAARPAPAFDPARGFDAKPLWVRLVVILAGVFMNFVFGFLAFVWLSYTQGQPVLPTIVADVEPAIVERIPELESWRGRTIRTLNGKPVSTWDGLQSVLREIPEGTSFVVGFDDGSRVRVEAKVSGAEIARALVPGLPPVVGNVQKGSAASEAGLRPGDRILALDSRPVRLWDDIPQYIRQRAGKPVVVTIERGGRTFDITVVPRRERAPGEDNKFVQVGHLGIAAKIVNRPVSLPQAFRQGSDATVRAGSLILGGLGQLVTGQVSLKSLGGPVAIGQITGYYQRQGLDQLLWWMGLFSINLAILNLLPIPVLDGGHVLFLLIEGVRGHPLSTQSKIRLSQAGMVMLILLMAWAVTSDVLRLFGL